MTVSEASALLSAYAGAGNTFLTRINLVRARLFEMGNWNGLVFTVTISVTTDATTSFPVVVLPSTYASILRAVPISQTATPPVCGCLPIGVSNIFAWFSSVASGYGANMLTLQELAPVPGAPDTKRYQTPTCVDDDYDYLCLVKLKYAALTQNSDAVYPNNIAALKAGLQALLAEDSDNRGLSRDLWSEAMGLLAEQSENEAGGAAGGSRVEVADDLDLELIGRGL